MQGMDCTENLLLWGTGQPCALTGGEEPVKRDDIFKTVGKPLKCREGYWDIASMYQTPENLCCLCSDREILSFSRQSGAHGIIRMAISLLQPHICRASIPLATTSYSSSLCIFRCGIRYIPSPRKFQGRDLHPTLSHLSWCYSERNGSVFVDVLERVCIVRRHVWDMVLSSWSTPRVVPRSSCEWCYCLCWAFFEEETLDRCNVARLTIEILQPLLSIVTASYLVEMFRRVEENCFAR